MNLSVDGITFKLKSMDIHIPSEHTIDGQHYPMEIQFVHDNKANGLAYVSMMIIPGRPEFDQPPTSPTPYNRNSATFATIKTTTKTPYSR